MFAVEMPKSFVGVDGRPFRKVKEGKDGKPIKTLDKDGQPIKAVDASGSTTYEVETEVASYTDMLGLFLNNVFGLVANKAQADKEIKALKLEDSAAATEVFRAIHVAHEAMELETAPYEWLSKMLTEWGVEVYGVNAYIILEPIKKATEYKPTRAEARRESKQAK